MADESVPRIRLALSDDLEALLSLYKFLHDVDLSITRDVARENFDHIIASPYLNLFVIEFRGQLVSSCYLNVIHNLTRGGAPYGVIENVVTHPQFRRKGFGQSIVRYALNAAWETGCYKVMLMTGREENIPFYEGVGFDSSAKWGLLAKPRG